MNVPRIVSCIRRTASAAVVLLALIGCAEPRDALTIAEASQPVFALL